MTVLAGVNAFHVLGVALALWAVILALVGSSHAHFPGGGWRALAVGAVSIVLVVAAISAGIITSAREEGAGEAEPGRPGGRGGDGGEGAAARPGTQTARETEPPSAPRRAAGDPEAGRRVFSAAGCGSCHTLEEAGARGAIGPNFDETLPGRDAAYIRQSILEPNASIAQGFSPGVMPQDFGDRLSERQLNDLVAFISEATRP